MSSAAPKTSQDPDSEVSACTSVFFSLFIIKQMSLWNVFSVFVCVCRWRSGPWLCSTFPVRLQRICPSTRGRWSKWQSTSTLSGGEDTWRGGTDSTLLPSHSPARVPHTHTHTHTGTHTHTDVAAQFYNFGILRGSLRKAVCVCESSL